MWLTTDACAGRKFAFQRLSSSSFLSIMLMLVSAPCMLASLSAVKHGILPILGRIPGFATQCFQVRAQRMMCLLTLSYTTLACPAAASYNVANDNDTITQ